MRFFRKTNDSKRTNIIKVSNDYTSNSGTFIDDRDGLVYKWVRIGNQIWMAQNMAYIPHISPERKQGGIWVYGYEGDNVAEAKTTVEYKTYGCLYNWETAIKVVPDGWHIPTDAEWTTLADYLGGSDVAGGKMKEAGTIHWNKPNIGATDESGFSGLPGGLRGCSGGFVGIGKFGIWWSSIWFYFDYDTLDKSNWDRRLVYDTATINRDNGSQMNIYSVRCVRD